MLQVTQMMNTILALPLNGNDNENENMLEAFELNCLSRHHKPLVSCDDVLLLRLLLKTTNTDSLSHAL